MPGAAAPPLRSSSSAHVRWRCPPRRPWREGGGGEGGGGRGEGGGGSGAGGRRGRQRRRRQGQRRKRPVTGGTRGAPAPTCSVERERESGPPPPPRCRPTPHHRRRSGPGLVIIATRRGVHRRQEEKAPWRHRHRCTPRRMRPRRAAVEKVAGGREAGRWTRPSEEMREVVGEPRDPECLSAACMWLHEACGMHDVTGENTIRATSNGRRWLGGWLEPRIDNRAASNL